LLASCSKEEQTGKLSFGLEMSGDATLKSTTSGEGVVAALVTIRDAAGMVVFEKEYLELIRFGDQFVTRSLSLPVGEYTLTEFMLVSAQGNVLWATPKEGSPLAHLVQKPLPHRLGIRADQTTSQDIQVVRVGNYQPDDFGYAQFNIRFVDRFCLKVFLDCYTIADTTPRYDAAGVPYSQHRMVVTTAGGQLLEETLWPGTNQFSLPIVDDIYHVAVYGYHEELIFEQDFGLDELMEFSCDPDRPALYISCEPGPGIIQTPEGLTEPSIQQGVFGTVYSPLDDSMFIEGGDIYYPQYWDIWFFPYNPNDSLMMTGPIECYIPMDLVWQAPVAIVRTNANGIFQLELEAGQYYYLVQTSFGFTFGEVVTSGVPPGYVMVYPGEVTRMEIRLLDCSLWM